MVFTELVDTMYSEVSVAHLGDKGATGLRPGNARLAHETA